MNVKILIIEKLKENFSESIEKIEEYRDDLSISINSEKLLQVCNFLKSDPELQFIMCKDITAIDWAKKRLSF
jgi:NADH:ubiquinone oxidoreductase subunit C